jgi:hypothetical protein
VKNICAATLVLLFCNVGLASTTIKITEAQICKLPKACLPKAMQEMKKSCIAKPKKSNAQLACKRDYERQIKFCADQCIKRT